jgi:hypothetical protein
MPQGQRRLNRLWFSAPLMVTPTRVFSHHDVTGAVDQLSRYYFPRPLRNQPVMFLLF